MHQHQQTLADLEREQTPSTLELSVYLAVILAGIGSIILFLFSF